MKDKVQVIRNNLTGDLSKDIEFLNSLYDREDEIIQDARTTIDAINIILDEINQEQEDKSKEVEVEEVSEEQKEIDSKIDELLNHIDKESDDEAIASIEEILPKIESLTKSDDNVIYCSFSSEFEKMLFKRIFAGEKEVISTPYSNDIIYILYSDLLLKKKKKTAAMEALDRAIYWNFLSRTAREKKLNIYFEKKEVVKYLENLKLLQMISYTPEDIADCYNKYGYMFNELKDLKSAYAMYRLSYTYYDSEEISNILKAFEKVDPSLVNMTGDEILSLAKDNDVLIGVNNKILTAQRDIAGELISNGMFDQAKIMLENDYAMTNDEAIANIYNQLLEIEKNENLNKVEKEKKASSKTANKKKATTKKTTPKSGTGAKKTKSEKK